MGCCSWRRRGPGGSRISQSRGRSLNRGVKGFKLKLDPQGHRIWVDTAEECEGTEDSERGYPDNNGQGSEQEVKLFFAQFRSNVVNKGVDLTQSKHSKCLRERKLILDGRGFNNYYYSTSRWPEKLILQIKKIFFDG